MPLGLEDREANITKAQCAGKSLKNRTQSHSACFFLINCLPFRDVSDAVWGRWALWRGDARITIKAGIKPVLEVSIEHQKSYSSPDHCVHPRNHGWLPVCKQSDGQFGARPGEYGRFGPAGTAELT